MAIKVLYNDLRTTPPRLTRFLTAWYRGMTAQEALQNVLDARLVRQIVDDLASNKPEITVSWINEVTQEHSEIGGVGSLDWEIPDRSIVVVTYEDQTTTEEAVDTAITWMLEDEERPW